jgi:4-amino-4-deoxy-L-arabinose transferase
MITRTRNLFLIITTLLLAFAFQGSRGLFETTEGRYAEVSREMLETNTWLTPQLDYKPHWTKPPMIYWCIALSMKIFGVNTWGARICNSLFFCCIIILIFLLSKTIWGSNTGYVSWMVGTTAPFMFMGLQSLTIDTLLTLWELLTVFSYWKCKQKKDTASEKAWLTVLWFSAGISFLTKGPPGLLSLLCILIFNYLQKRRNRQFVKLLWAPGVIVFLLSGFLWYFIVIVKNPGLMHYYLSNEIAGRIFTDQHHRNSSWIAPLYIYILPLLIGLGPWLYLWISALKKGSFKSFAIIKRRILSSDGTLFLIIWCIIPLLILSLVRSRLVLYMLPFFPALIILTSLMIVRLQPVKVILVCRNFFIYTALFLLILKGSMAFIPSSKNMYQLYSSIKEITSERFNERYSIISTHHDLLYGLQFYLKGNLQRENCNDLLNGIKLKRVNPLFKSGNSTIIIIDNYPGDSLSRYLRKANILYFNKRVNKKYSIYLIDINNHSPAFSPLSSTNPL